MSKKQLFNPDKIQSKLVFWLHQLAALATGSGPTSGNRHNLTTNQSSI